MSEFKKIIWHWINELFDIHLILELVKHTTSILAVAASYAFLAIILHYIIHNESDLKFIELVESYFIRIVMVWLALQFMHFLWLKRVKKNDPTIGVVLA